MGGGLMQLVAYGAQDIYLTGNPQITFFKVVYRRHTNFSMESIECTFNGTVDFGRKSNATISRNGDLIGSMYLQIKLPALKQDGAAGKTQWTNGIGNALVKSVEVEIGGQQIDKHYGEWLDIWGELNVGRNHRDAHNEMVGHDNNPTTNNADTARTLYVPLRFWFNRNPGLALPLIALQYHEVKINLDLENVVDLVRGTDATVTSALALDSSDAAASITSCQLYVDYIYLDTDERRRFAQVSHEYLIEQLQHTGVESLEANSTSEKVTLNFNHPVKSLHWVIQNDDYLNSSNNKVTDSGGSEDIDNGKNVQGGQKLVYYVNQGTNNRNDTFDTAKLMLNGHDRAPERDSDYFRLVQNAQHMEVSPTKTIYTYSFALRASEHQPSGTCNFSRIDNATLSLTFNTNQKAGSRSLKLYAVNYNVLRIMSGMGGLAYSN
jgi:hypothetical protein